MKMTFTFKHLDHSDSLQTYASQRIEEISRFLLKDGHGQCVFSKTRNEFQVEVSLNTKLKFFRASSHHQDIYHAVDEVVAKLEKQFLKIRKQHKHHKNLEHYRWKRSDEQLELYEDHGQFKIWRKAA